MAALKEVPTEELLNFQDYPTTHTMTTPTFDTYPEVTVNVDTNSTPRQDEAIPSDVPKKSLWSVEYFQRFFDVDTVDVKNRIIGSLLPRKSNLLKDEMKLRPDLYGPFWISVTLVFTIAISGNIANYLQHKNIHYKWKYDFHLVSYAASTIFFYISLVPLTLWGLFKWSWKDSVEASEAPSALELICLYGYSLFIYIPASILWTIQISWLQWFLVLVATCLSGTVLLLTLSTSLNSSKHKLILGVIILGMHLMLAAGFMLFFFHVPQATFDHPQPVIPEVIKAVNASKT